MVIAIAAPVAVDLIGGDDFADAVGPLQVLGVAIVGTFFIALWGQALLSLREHRVLLVANASALAVALVLTLLLAPAHGALGGAIATTATELWLAVVYLVVLARRHPHLRPQPAVLPRVLLAAAVAVVPALFLPALAGAIVAAVIYAGLLLALRAVPTEVFEALGVRRP
jgi:O-antigen/teichoic acid export membrane protein